MKKPPHEVANSVERMTEDGFGEKPVFEFFVAEVDGPNIRPLPFSIIDTPRGKEKPSTSRTW